MVVRGFVGGASGGTLASILEPAAPCRAIQMFGVRCSIPTR